MGQAVGNRQHYVLSKNDSERINILKVWLTIMVVFIHSVGSEINLVGGGITFDIPVWLDWVKYIITNVISRCAVPAFFFLSAILLYKKPFVWRDNIRKKIRTLLVPYTILNTFWIVFFFSAQQIDAVSVFFSNPDNIVANWSVYDWIDAYLGFTGFPILFPLWFIRDLMVLHIIAKLLKIIIDKFPKITAFILIALFFLNVDTHIFCLSINPIFFFCAGYYIVKYDLHFSDLKKINNYILVSLYLCSIIADCITRGMAYHYITHNIVIIIGILFFAKLTTQFNNGDIKDKLLWISQFSIAIYFFHEHFLNIYTKLLARLLPTSALFQLLQYFGNVFVIIFLCILFSALMKRFLPKLYYLLTGNR